MKHFIYILLAFGLFLPALSLAKDDSVIDDLWGDMQEFVVIASKKAESIFDSPLSTSVISKEKILRSGATSIPELLRLVPGFIVREKTNGNYDVHIRGNDYIPPGKQLFYSENSITLVMIDNRIVYNYVRGGTFWETLPIGLNDIEQIEIIRGPSTALYGPNAVSGVINIITKKPGDKKMKVSTNVQAGNMETKTADASLSVAVNEKLKLRFSGNYQYRERAKDEYFIFHIDFADTVFAGNFATYNDLVRSGMWESKELGKRYPDSKLAKDVYGINGFAFYDMNDDVNFNLAVGLQNSTVQTIYWDMSLAFSTRESETSYFDLRSKIYGMSAQLSYSRGTQNIARGLPGLKMDISALSATVEYDYKWKNLTLRPGASFHQAVNDDRDYINAGGTYFWNAKNELNTSALYLRGDYLLNDKLRFVGAIRGDKYNNPDKTYASYQFTSSYKVNDNYLARLVYSRANRSPFMLETYESYHYEGSYGDFRWISDNYGSKNLDLLTMDMIEVGFRNKLIDKIFTDIEFFYTKIDNYTDAVDTFYIDSDGVQHFEETFENLNIVSKQMGISMNVAFILSEKLKFELFWTSQKTDLEDHETPDGNLIDMESEWTPISYGGLSCDYSPIDKLNLFSNMYFYGNQTFKYSFGREFVQNIEEKMIVNLKASYHIYEYGSVYFNARNILNDDKKEFAFADDIKATYLVGFTMKF
ncbi:MAG: hypothetical protein B6244_00705 [Candidatus Cloacimonetes bacterium 4572_55]|nr:MAG: hypothetical protein B6244_00705 [Candidatus Cloacimonetes bacterium 4572_55]